MVDDDVNFPLEEEGEEEGEKQEEEEEQEGEEQEQEEEQEEHEEEEEEEEVDYVWSTNWHKEEEWYLKIIEEGLNGRLL